MYDENCDLLSSTKSRIYHKYKCELEKATISYRSVMELNILLFDPADLIIFHNHVS